ncbi:MAG: Holliday junction resolvase RecU [Bacillota bacterium]|nr:Holliday junction resolvase RecU [Bacillota bacterium]
MSTIKYPNGSAPQKTTSVRDFHSGRGMNLENDINDSNKFYRESNIALIYKKPTPVQVVRVDYPDRKKAKITEAYYRTPSTTDYNGIYRGKYIDFEAKESANKTSFPLFMVHPHQISHLEKVHMHGGIGFFIIRFKEYGVTYLVDSMVLIKEIKRTEKSSIPYKWFEENGHVIKEGLCPRLAYLKVVDACYFKED